MQAALLHLSQMRDELDERSTLAAQQPTETTQQLGVREMPEPPEAIDTIHDGSIHHRSSSPSLPRHGPIRRSNPRAIANPRERATDATYAPVQGHRARLDDPHAPLHKFRSTDIAW